MLVEGDVLSWTVLGNRPTKMPEMPDGFEVVPTGGDDGWYPLQGGVAWRVDAVRSRKDDPRFTVHIMDSQLKVGNPYEGATVVLSGKDVETLIQHERLPNRPLDP